MAKQDQHNHKGNDQNKSEGPNRRSESQTIVAGIYKLSHLIGMTDPERLDMRNVT